MRGKSFRSLSLILLVMLLMSACQPGAPGTPTAPPPSPTLTPQPPTATPDPPTATPEPDPCPPSADVPLPAAPVDFPEGYVETLRRYLTAGGDPAQLTAILEQWEALSPQSANVLRADLTGDGVEEFAVAFIDPESMTFPPEGVAVVFACREGSVVELARFVPEEFAQAALIGVEDVDEDGVAELVFSEIYCGAHTCMHTVRVWSWTGEAFVDLVAGDFILPYPDFELREGDILAASHGFGSIGAGPQRTITETWAWDGSAVTRAEVTEAPPVYRYHALLDADRALYAEAYPEAREGYQRVIEDDDLDPWAAAYDAPEERQWFEALALWRLVTLDMELENFATAEERYATLQETHPPGVAGHPVAALAEVFWSAYLETGNVSLACEETAAAPESEAVLEFLNSFGYANPTYSAAELCPF